MGYKGVIEKRRQTAVVFTLVADHQHDFPLEDIIVRDEAA